MDESRKVALKIAFPRFEEAPATYANNLTVQFLGGEFVVTFYAVFPPMAPVEDLSESLEVPARCVARVVIPKDRMREMLDALNENVDRAVSVSGSTPPR